MDEKIIKAVNEYLRNELEKLCGEIMMMVSPDGSLVPATILGIQDYEIFSVIPDKYTQSPNILVKVVGEFRASVSYPIDNPDIFPGEGTDRERDFTESDCVDNDDDESNYQMWVFAIGKDPFELSFLLSPKAHHEN